jgi:hypothetical protein
MNRMPTSSVTTEMTTNLASDAKRRATRVLLTEEEYVSNLTDIVTRDFYPAIPSLQRDIAILDCRSRGDVIGAIAIRRKSRLEESHGVLTVDKNDRAVTSSITEFHESAASEDNVEFEKNQQQEMLLHSQQIHQLYYQPQQRRRRLMDDNNSSTDKCVTMEEESALASDLFTVPKNDTANNDSNKIEDEHPIRNALFFYPAQEDYDTNKEKLKTLLSKISHQNDYLRIQQHGNNNDCSKHNNKSMYATDPNVGGKSSKSENETKIVAATAEAASSNGSRKRNIQYSQTRFPYQNSSRLPPTTSTRHQSQKTLFLDTIDDSDTDLDATPLTSLSIARKERVSRISKELYTFIPMTPLRAPPSLLSKPTKGRLSNNESAPGGKWTPAAQRLLDRTTSSSSSIITNARMGSAFRSALRSSYTPKLPPSVGSSRSRKISSATPRATDVSYSNGNNHFQPMNTNDLLHIP